MPKPLPVQKSSPKLERLSVPVHGLRGSELAVRLRADQEQRWAFGSRVPAEEYLRVVPGLAEDAEAVLDLLYSELLLREAAGEKPVLEEYVRRFPAHEQSLRRQLALHEALVGNTKCSDSHPTGDIASSSFGEPSRSQVNSLTSKPALAENAISPSHQLGGAGLEKLPGKEGAMIMQAFVERLSDSGIVTRAEIDKWLKSQPEASRSVEVLARNLVKQKKLTPYQASVLRDGKGEALILNEYAIMDQIGAGGMGRVFKALHRRMERIVALKMLPKEKMNAPEAIDRFRREVRAAAKLTHPNIVAAYDAGEHEGIHYLVMEFVEGTDLSKHVKRHGAVGVDQGVAYVIQAARGLEYAHAKGVIHRDIKPANLLLSVDGTVKILDMGLARILPAAEDGSAGGDRTEITVTGIVMGTLDYIAPEQTLDVKTADHRADIYSLGCTLHFLVTGKVVYSGDSKMKRFSAHREGPIPSLRTARPEVSEALDAVFKRMVAKKPEDRFQSMTALGHALTQCVDFEARTQTLNEPRTQTIVHKRTGARPRQSAVTRQARNARFASVWPNTRRQWVKLGIGLAAVLGGVVLAALVIKWRTPAGTVIVEIDQPGAEISVDGKQLAIRPAGEKEPVKIEVEPGKHQLTVSKGGFKTWTEQFTLKSEGMEPVRVRLVKAADASLAARPNEADFEKWVQTVAALPAAEQVKEVVKKLHELNPQFTDKVHTEIVGGVVTQFQFEWENVTDISPLRALKGMTCLLFGGDGKQFPLVDLSPLRGMRLERLHIRGTQVADLSPLLGMPLTELFFDHTRVADLSPLKGMPLTRMGFGCTPVSDLAPLAGMPLTDLQCSETLVADLSPLKGMKLTDLACYSTQITDLRPLAGMPLAFLDCGDTLVFDLAPLAGMPLTELRCQATQVADLSPLKGMKLKGLTCYSTRIADLGPLAGMPLMYLHCAATPVADLSLLKGMQLAWLNCSNTKIADLSPLKGMPLTTLRFKDTPATDFSVVKEMPLKDLWWSFRPGPAAAIVRSLKGLETINEKPAKDFWKEVDAAGTGIKR